MAVPGAYCGRNKTFFGGLGVFFSRYGASGAKMTICGNHSMKFGFEIGRDRINRHFLGGGAAIFTFSNQLTSQPVCCHPVGIDSELTYALDS